MVLGGWFLLIFLDGIPTFAQTLFISVSILGDDGSDAFGMHQREPQSYWCAVIENVDGKAPQANCLREIGDGFGQVLNPVSKTLSIRSIGRAKTRKVESDSMLAIGARPHQVAVQ